MRTRWKRRNCIFISNALERKKQGFELRVLNDEKQLALVGDRMRQKMSTENETAKHFIAEISREYQKILAETEKEVEETKEKANFKSREIIAQAELDAQILKAEIK